MPSGSASGARPDMLDTKGASNAPLRHSASTYSWVRRILDNLIILSIGLIPLALVQNSSKEDFDVALVNYREHSADQAKAASTAVSSALQQVYQNLRTISLLPSVIKIDRHGEGLGDDARLAIQQIYNNLMSNVSVSEVYIVPAGFNPDRIDPKTGKLEEPILMFDELITFFSEKSDQPSAESTTEAEAEAEVEIHEYRQLQRHIAYLGKLRL
jgi:hypothetical protein